MLEKIDGKIMSNIIMPGMKGSFDIITNEKNLDNEFSIMIWDLNISLQHQKVR